ncbi:O-antigen polymerase [Halalkalibacterium ligniniphilum]|uniref:O-antigen polymerase n=1 Tax=Halalkalibacterium ligniniphilum TaxID=1134413 RepID=UPI0003467C5A|nr:O-antigen polymerase [Halalkalibacterium ligniniphilum]
MWRQIEVKKKYLSTIFFTLLLKIVLEYGYYTFVHPLFGYSGFYLEVSLIKMLESYIVVIFLSFLFSTLDDVNKPSKIVCYILFINLFLPISSLYWLQNQSRVFFLVIFFSCLLLYFMTKKLKPIQVATLKEGSNVAFFVVIGITISVYGYLIVTGGLQRINLNLLNVYETRDYYSESNVPLMGYLLPWQAHVINLFFLIYGLIKSSKKIIVFTLFLQVFLFSMTNFKSFLFAPLVVVGLYFILKNELKNKLLLLMTFSLSVLMILLILMYEISENIVLLSIFLRRLFFVPASLQYTYYDFFENMEKYKLSNSIFSSFFENPYNIGPVGLIAREVYGREFAPNVGIFGDGYLNFGLIGIILFVMILGGVLLIFDSVARKSPTILSMSIIIIPSMSLVNSAMFTSFATHGILFAIFITWLTSTLFNQTERNTL